MNVEDFSFILLTHFLQSRVSLWKNHQLSKSKVKLHFFALRALQNLLLSTYSYCTLHRTNNWGKWAVALYKDDDDTREKVRTNFFCSFSHKF